MALIRCPECGEKVSDSAQICIHCGYPLKQSLGKSLIDGKEFDLSFILNNGEDKMVESIGTLRAITGCGLADGNRIVKDILHSGVIPPFITLTKNSI